MNLVKNGNKRHALLKSVMNVEVGFIKLYIACLIFVSGHAVAQLVDALRYKPEDRGFDSRWCHWNISLT
jgi:hypothetical protein